nr:MAG TPA: hypothetical protein [Caudoviricetes sp.]
MTSSFRQTCLNKTPFKNAQTHSKTPSNCVDV